MAEKKRVAAIVTVYRRHSHADVIVGKILEGYRHKGGKGPNLRLVSAYVDQQAKGDLSQGLSQKHKFPICKTIEEALTLGGKQLAVDGVICIGEHGNYPTNKRGQKLYPRRRFFEGVTQVFAKVKKSVPVFSDKHLSATWEDAKWMYDQSRKLFVPFLAGSSVPVAWRRPPLKLPMNCQLSEAVQIGYGGAESYGFHALEGLQCMTERRKGGETGVKAVTCVQGEAIRKVVEQGRVSGKLLEAAMARAPDYKKGDYLSVITKNNKAGVYLIEYRDGFKASVVMMNGWPRKKGGAAFCFAGQIKGEKKPRATHFYLQPVSPYGHFIYLVKAIESLVQTGHAPYPVERTLLTTGVLEAAMISRSEKNRRVETKHLNVKYKPRDWPFATDPVPKPIKR